jgi:eukaryotic-like serine/threonine-protein kinase
LQAWQEAWAPGGHPRGAALISAAIDLRRAGYASPVPKALLEDLHLSYLEQRGGGRLKPEPLEEAWRWATRPIRAGISLLNPADADRYSVFDYLLDTVRHWAPVGEHVPAKVVISALEYADAVDAADVYLTAWSQGRYQLAETAIRHALAIHKWQLGPDHPSTLTSRKNLDAVQADLLRPREAG